MRKQSQFSKERLVYWSEEFADVVNLLTGKDADGNATHPALCGTNADAVALAAAVGVQQKRRRELGGGGRKEVSTGVFSARGLEPHIFLVGLLCGSMSNVEILRPENEEILIKEFQDYAAGGFEFLRTEFAQAPTKGPDWVIEKLFSKTYGESLNQEIPDLI